MPTYSTTNKAEYEDMKIDNISQNVDFKQFGIYKNVQIVLKNNFGWISCLE